MAEARPPFRPDTEGAAFRDDPVRFARQVLGHQPWAKQVEILEAVRDFRRVTVRACHGVGKTWVAADVALWFLLTRPRSIVLTTAPTQRQVRHLLWRYIRAAHRRANLELPGDLLTQSLTIDDDWFAIGVSTDEPDAFQGYHADELLLIVDEAAGVRDDLFDAAQGVLTGEGGTVLYVGNPTVPAGRFYESHQSSSWKRVHVSAFDCPNVVEGRTVIPQLVTQRWVDERREEWGEGSDLFRARVLGEFPSRGTRSLIAMSWVDAMLLRDTPPGEPTVVGVDVARFGDCETATYVRQGQTIVAAQHWRGRDLMETAGRIVAIAATHSADLVLVDSVGLGAGVLDRLVELGVPAQPFEGGSAAPRPDRYARLRDQAYAALAERLEHGRLGWAGDLPPDEQLRAQLLGIRYTYTSDGLQQVETKDAMASRGLASPDRADALAMTCWTRPGASSVRIEPDDLGYRLLVAHGKAKTSALAGRQRGGAVAHL